MRFEHGRRPGLPPKVNVTPRLLVAWAVLVAVVVSIGRRGLLVRWRAFKRAWF